MNTVRKPIPQIIYSVMIMALLLGSSVRSVAKVAPLAVKNIDVNVLIHGNVGMTQSQAEDFAENLLKAAKFHVVDDGDGPDVLEVTVVIEADDDDDDDDGIPDSKDDDDDGDGESDENDHDNNDGQGFHIVIEVEGGWHDDTDCDKADQIDDIIESIFDEVVDHLHEIDK